MSAGSMTLAQYSLEDPEDGVALHLQGDWTALALGDASRRLDVDLDGRKARTVDITALGRLDTAGALVLLRAMEENATVAGGEREDFAQLTTLVRPALEQPSPEKVRRTGLPAFFDRFGRQIVGIARDGYEMLVFTGEMMTALGRSLIHPSRLRVTPLVATMQEAGINSLPIVFMMTFFIGAVIALVGTNLLTTLGVGVFTVQLVGVAILREFGVVIAAILLAGRSASSFAAQIGSMRMNQETDAMQVMGVDRFDALVVPRILAALLMIPLMTFAADIGGIIGGLLVSWVTMDIHPIFFVQRMLDTVSITHFWIGMSKAPFLALVIAAAGCRHGLMVGGDVQSLGRQVTSAVVQSVFLVIMFDAIFAVIFMALDL
ncbi:ABC transporter permease [Sphingobium sp. WTD-1]|jgi:phospholipid/cholesterol/gamma-HCH transport system permease protein|uniref:MlaE family ABC transporter permease n=1 Tax=unclassified Sphingobium TaxID=2611147 RepID=UPI001E6395F5|nr:MULTISPECIES: ABC transporter permease [unclassified Sphingobium]WIA54843.1 ABC transporter permease [Sphingobium sp. WTD-1]